MQDLSCDSAQYNPVCGEQPGMDTSNNMDVEGEHDPAPGYCAPSTVASTGASTAAAPARPINFFFRHEEENSPTPVAPCGAAAAVGTVTGANVAATALAQHPVAEPLAAARTKVPQKSPHA